MIQTRKSVILNDYDSLKNPDKVCEMCQRCHLEFKGRELGFPTLPDSSFAHLPVGPGCPAREEKQCGDWQGWIPNSLLPLTAVWPGTFLTLF